MKLKAKLISTISAACLVIALLVTGVWAVSTASVTLGGTIKFNATNVNATITGTVEGATEVVTLETLEYNSNTDVDSDAFKAKLATWSNDLEFTDDNEIKMTITVTNKSTERDLYLTLTDNTNVTNLTDVVKNGETAYTSGTEVKVDKGGTNSVTFNITLSATSTDYSVKGNYAYKVDLADDSTKVPPTILDSNKKAGSLTYTLNTSAKTAEVSSYDESEANVVIPAQVKYGEDVYDVTSIAEYAFSYTGTLTSLSIPESITELRGCPISSCPNLTSIDIPSNLQAVDCSFFSSDTVKTYSSYKGGKYFGNEQNPYLIFCGLESSTAETVEFHKDTKLIKCSALTSGKSIKALWVPDSIVFIGGSAFGWGEYSDDGLVWNGAHIFFEGDLSFNLCTCCYGFWNEGDDSHAPIPDEYIHANANYQDYLDALNA